MDSFVSSGMVGLDDVIQGLRLGDNVVWQTDNLDDYTFFARPFIDRAIADGRTCVYMRFAPHKPVLDPQPGLITIEFDPEPGFDSFSAAVQRTIGEYGRRTFYVFDNLSSLVEEWATDELLANFFQVTCPYLFELETIAYFALTHGRHAHSAVARIRDTTQILIDLYRVEEDMYIHPLKVWDRYSPQMFLPHQASGSAWEPVSASGAAAEVSTSARRYPVRGVEGSIAPWESVYRRLFQYQESGGDMTDASPELEALKKEFSRMLLGRQPDFNTLADRYVTLEDLLEVRDRLIGSGQIGGKAAGMLLARRILLSANDESGVDFRQVLDSHDSFYIGSDVFFTFLVENNLFRLRLKLTSSSKLTHEEFAAVEERFLAGRFSPAIMEQFRNMLDYFGQAPIIARSSSLLEDSFGNAFAGKYRSEFCANQGSPDERLEAFTKAVKRVYASALNPDALCYRRSRGLSENDEQMAILVQRVSGMPFGNYFFPTVAGVAFSRNLYAWSDRIDPEQGVVRLVFGLGTRAVDRVGNDYPRMIAVSNPDLRPETGSSVIKYSQRDVDILDLQANELVTRPIRDLLSGPKYPNLHLFVSIRTEDYVQDPISAHVPSTPAAYVLTFNNFVKRTKFVTFMRAILEKLEDSYGHAVDIEFTARVQSDGETKIDLLQCRPLFVPGSTGPIDIPDDLASEQILFRSDRMISGGVRRDMRYIVYIDPQVYAAHDVNEKKSLGRIVGMINEHPEVIEGGVLMMGPGRWGSSNVDLGVNVGYADIDNASVLIEVAREEAGHVPEVSYGTHFFQDLVEAQIIYLPLYPDEPSSEFNDAFFGLTPNALADLIPDAADFDSLVHVIDVPATMNGAHAHVIADPHTRRAVCFLA